MAQETYGIRAFLRDLRAPYAWPGGYPRFFVCSDGEALSFDSARENKRLIMESIRDGDRASGWHVCGADINWEDSQLVCSDTGKPIQSAYGED